MRFFAALLSLYVLSLVCVPCADDLLHGNIPGWEQCAHPDGGGDHHDACSPFCICSCCNVPVTVAAAILAERPTEKPFTAFFPETSRFISSFEVNFWQPPKIG
ncbi:MAG TPA: hypothetical protein PLK82_11710 [Bacteroidales bacterium]|nr:hypothetical protein [Bacteroidales bacterium]